MRRQPISLPSSAIRPRERVAGPVCRKGAAWPRRCRPRDGLSTRKRDRAP